MPESERRLAAIMFTDMVGYTALGQKDETLSLALVEEAKSLLRPVFARHHGRVVKVMGDAFLVEFVNALDAVRCGYDIQRASREFNISMPSDKKIRLRVGIHLGDVVGSQGDISGDAVNVASRIEPLAEEGGVCLTRQVYESAHNKFEVPLVSIGMKLLKNVSEPMEVYRMEMPWKVGQGLLAENNPRKIAVLPFVNMSPDPNDAYFADGITEEIISTVSGVSGLGVISRTSVMGYKGTTKKVGEIGRELGVGSVLEGSLRKAGNRIRITTQLIDVKNDLHIWAQSYDREVDDIFAVQSDIAKKVADALKTTIKSSELDRIDKVPTENSAAYALYLRGRYHFGKRELEELKMAAQCFEQAIREDPNFALGYVGLADCYMVTAHNWGIDQRANYEKARALVDKALELDPELAEAHATKGTLLASDFNLGQAELELKRAIELKPGYASAHHWYFLVLRCELRWDEAQREVEKALELDPFSPIVNVQVAFHYLFSGRDSGKAIEFAKRAIELSPSYWSWHRILAHIYHDLKMRDDAKREAEISIRMERESYPQIEEIADAIIAYLEDDKPRLKKLMPEVETHLGEGPGKFSAFGIAEYYFYLGMNEEGFRWLEHSFVRKESDLIYIRIQPDFAGVRADPRYLHLLERLGLT